MKHKSKIENGVKNRVNPDPQHHLYTGMDERQKPEPGRVPKSSRTVYSGPVAGFAYYDGVDVWPKLHIGRKLRLVAEPSNTYDPNAVAIYFKKKKLGYLPRRTNTPIAVILNAGHHIFGCRVQRLDEKANPEDQLWVAVRVKKTE